MAKRVTALFIAVLMLFISVTVSVSAAEDQTGAYRVAAAGGVKMYREPTSDSMWITVVRKDACLTVLKTQNGFGYAVYDSFYGWVDLNNGLIFVKSDPYMDADGNVDGLIDLKLTSLPKKLTYTDGEESADVNGLVVTAVFSDGSEMNVTGYSVAFPALKNPGKKAVSVLYGGKTASFFVTVNRVPVSGIEVTKLPDKTSYIEGELISLDGLEITASYTDGRKPKKVTDCIISGIELDGSAAPGNYNVKVTYKYNDITTAFPITVASKSLKSLKLSDLPSNTTIYQGQSLDFTGITVTAVYDNGKTVTTSDYITEYDNETVGTNTARVYYDGKFAAFDFEVLELKEKGIEIVPPADASSFAGKEPDFSALKVYIVYNSGEKVLTDDYKITSDINTGVAGSYRVTVSHGKFSQFFEFRVLGLLPGDVNRDGRITTNDVKLALRCAAKLDELEPAAFAAADINADEKITTADVKRILRAAAQIEPLPSYGQEETSEPVSEQTPEAYTEPVSER